MAEVLTQRAGDVLSQPASSKTAVEHVEYYEDPAGGPIGERLVAHVVDDLARRTPDRIYATVTKSRYDLDQGFRDITVRQLADSVNCASWFIHERFGRSTSFDVVAYLGVSDIRYATYLYAAIKTGHVVSTHRDCRYLEDTNGFSVLAHDPFGAELLVTAPRCVRGGKL